MTEVLVQHELAADAGVDVEVRFVLVREMRDRFENLGRHRELNQLLTALRRRQWISDSLLESEVFFWR